MNIQPPTYTKGESQEPSHHVGTSQEEEQGEKNERGTIATKELTMK